MIRKKNKKTKSSDKQDRIYERFMKKAAQRKDPGAEAYVEKKMQDFEREAQELERKGREGRRIVGPVWKHYTLVCVTPKKYVEGVRYTLLNGHMGLWYMITDENKKMPLHYDWTYSYMLYFGDLKPERVFKKVVYEREGLGKKSVLFKIKTWR